jgi:hypothetical protein
MNGRASHLTTRNPPIRPATRCRSRTAKGENRLSIEGLAAARGTRRHLFVNRPPNWLHGPTGDGSDPLTPMLSAMQPGQRHVDTGSRAPIAVRPPLPDAPRVPPDHPARSRLCRSRGCFAQAPCVVVRAPTRIPCDSKVDQFEIPAARHQGSQRQEAAGQPRSAGLSKRRTRRDRTTGSSDAFLDLKCTPPPRRTAPFRP